MSNLLRKIKLYLVLFGYIALTIIEERFRKRKRK